MRINIKPLSVNQCWKGKRFKTPKYKSYEQELLFRLNKYKLPQPPFEIHFKFGFSSKLSDWDNPVKPLQDILQKKYVFSYDPKGHAIGHPYSKSQSTGLSKLNSIYLETNGKTIPYLNFYYH